MRNKLLLSIAFAVFFYVNFTFAGDPHFLYKNWYDERKAGLLKENVTSIVITNDPSVYKEAAMIANGSLVLLDDEEKMVDDSIDKSNLTDESYENNSYRANEKTNLPYWDIDGRGLIAFVRDESQVVICFPEENELRFGNSAEGCFSFCKYIENEDYELDEYDEIKRNVRPESEIDNEFFGTDLVSKLEYIEGFELIKTSGTTDMSRLFYGDLNLEQVNLSFLDTRNVTDMSHMFENCFHLLNIDVTTFNVSSVNNMNSMFKSCRQLRSLDFSFWDTSSVKNMSHMLSDCVNLKSINFGTFNTSAVETMSHMFYNCKNLTSLDLSFLRTKQLKSARSMLEECSSLKVLSLSMRLGRFGKDLKLKGIWKNMSDGKVYNLNLDENVNFNTGLYFRLS